MVPQDSKFTDYKTVNSKVQIHVSRSTYARRALSYIWILPYVLWSPLSLKPGCEYFEAFLVELRIYHIFGRCMFPFVLGPNEVIPTERHTTTTVHVHHIEQPHKYALHVRDPPKCSSRNLNFKRVHVTRCVNLLS